MPHDGVGPAALAKEIRIREVRSEDVPQLADLHCRVFPDYFLTHLGKPLLKDFYREFVAQQGNYGFVAIRDGRPVAAVIGTANGDAFYHRFYRRNLGRVAAALTRGLVRDRTIRRNVLARAGHVRHAVRSVLIGAERPDAASGPTAPSSNSAALLSIGVDPAHRGQGIARELTDRFCQELCQDGIREVELWVRPENQAAIDFYQNTGWRERRATASVIQFHRTTETGLRGR